MNKLTGTKVFTTDEYDLFQKLLGNRDVSDDRVNKIIKSIKTIGWIHNPIIVNENMEVIDGQGRLQALKRLDMEVEYIISQGAGIKECIEMNINMQNWSVEDYVHSFVKQGMKDYIWISDIHSKYPPLKLSFILALATSGGHKTQLGSKAKTDIQNGLLSLTDVQKARVIEVLDYLYQFYDTVVTMGDRKFHIFNAIIFCYDHPDCNNDRLLKVFKTNYDKIVRVKGAQEYLEQIEDIYNANLRSDGTIKKMYIASDFKKHREQTDI